MQGIYTCIPETNHVPKEPNVAAILSLLFMMPISLALVLALMYFYISTFRSMCALLLLLLLLTAGGNADKISKKTYINETLQNTVSTRTKITKTNRRYKTHTPTHYKTS
jgi:hypothetical protein